MKKQIPIFCLTLSLFLCCAGTGMYAQSKDSLGAKPADSNNRITTVVMGDDDDNGTSKPVDAVKAPVVNAVKDSIVTKPVDAPANVSVVKTDNNTTIPKPADSITKPSIVKVDSTPKTTQPVVVGATIPAPAAVASTTANPGDLIYHIQVIVVGDKSKIPNFFRKYKIKDAPVYEPPDGTPVRVMIGNYSDYNAAKSHCDALKSEGLAAVFVAPYYQGKRITISEATTHASQK